MKDIIKKISKNIFIFPLLLVMLTLVIGVSYAYYEISFAGKKEVSLNVSGGISLTFNWNNTSYTLDDDKMSNEEGKEQDTYYEFSVSATASKPKNINYLIYIEEDQTNTIDNSNVFVYLTDDYDNMMKSPALVNSLATYQEVNTKSLFVNGFSFVKEGTKIHNYRLRSWLDEDSTSTGEYKYRVRVVVSEDEKTSLDQEGVYITSARYLSDTSVDEVLCEIENAYATKFDTNIVLSSSDDSSITYEITIYNENDHAYYLKEIIKDEYTNEDITYTLGGFNINDEIASKESKTFTITYHYKNGAKANTLSADLEFKFAVVPYVLSTYVYSGDCEKYVIPKDGIYKIELWGASGGNSMCQGTVPCGTIGLGAYTSGLIKFQKNQEFYVCIGGKGADAVPIQISKGGFNGGGNGISDGSESEANSNSAESAGGGGGATDIRLVGGSWNDFDSLKSRIMVASGGAGAVWRNDYTFHSGGGLSTNTYNRIFYYKRWGDSQIEVKVLTPNTTQTTGYKFGIGADGIGMGDSDGSAGGGGGYYGGFEYSSDDTNKYANVSGGGSSFISGHDGCNAILESSTENNIVHAGKSIHYSNHQFYNTIMIDGEGYSWTTSRGNYTGMPSYDGTSIMMGNTGNGYAKITYFEDN